MGVGLLVAFTPAATRADAIRVHATNVAAKAVSAIADKLKEEGIELRVNTEGGSSVGIAALTNGSVDIAITIRQITPQERSAAPEKRFIEETLAFQALALIVSDDVWGSGVRALSKEQMTDIYEGRAKNWKQFGGEDRAIKFYNPDQGQGVWEPFVTWLYGDVRKASLGANFEAVRSAEDARDSVEFNRGSLSVAPPRVADGKGVYALSIKDEKGTAIAPTLAEMTSERYPLARPIVAIVGNKPTGDLRKAFEYLRSEEAQGILAKSGLVPVPSEGIKP